MSGEYCDGCGRFIPIDADHYCDGRVYDGTPLSAPITNAPRSISEIEVRMLTTDELRQIISGFADSQQWRRAEDVQLEFARVNGLKVKP